MNIYVALLIRFQNMSKNFFEKVNVSIFDIVKTISYSEKKGVTSGNEVLRMSSVKNPKAMKEIIPKVLQIVLNTGLTVLAVALCVMLVIEMVDFLEFIVSGEKADYKYFLANILVFFLYFEFITMIVKYFKEDYHFPLRYFMYIGITAMLRLIIVEHDSAMDTLIFALVILILIIGNYIINITPRERPKAKP